MEFPPPFGNQADDEIDSLIEPVYFLLARGSVGGGRHQEEEHRFLPLISATRPFPCAKLKEGEFAASPGRGTR